MIYYDVLQRKHKELWDLVELLSDKKVISSEKGLCEELAISEFVLTQRFRDLNDSWQAVFGKPLVDLEQFLVEEIYISDNQELLYKQSLLDHSVANEMLLELLIDSYDLKVFTEKNDVSQAGAYRLRREIRDALARWGVTVDKTHAIGDELTIRNLIMSILNFREIDYAAYANEEVVTDINAAVEVFEEVYQFDLKPTQRCLLTNVFYLAKVRQSKGHYHKKLVSVKYTEKDKEMIQRLGSYLPVPIEVMQYESDQLLLFLYTYELIQDVDFEASPEVAKIEAMDSVFSRLVIELMDVGHIPPAKFEQMFEQCRRIHWRNFLFQNYFNSFSFMNDSDWAGVSQRLFETIDRLYEEFQLLPAVFDGEKDQRYSLYSDYFFVLTNYINDDETLPVVNICVDFSQSSIMFDLTRRLFEVLWFCNLKVQENVDADTQLFISDRHVPWLDLPQLIWTGPPHYRELMVLTRLVNQITGRSNHPSDDKLDELIRTIPE